MRAITSANMKRMNRKTVFDIIRARREVTRVELSEITGMSGPSILTIVNEFLETGILVPLGKQSTAAGRRPVSLAFNPDVMLSIGIEYEGNNLSVGVVNLDGDIRFQTVSKVPANLGDEFFAVVEKNICKVEEHLARENLDYCGIGLGIPGAMNHEDRVVYFAPYVGVNTPLDISPQLAALEARFKKPVFIENDVNASAIGEFYVRDTSQYGDDLLYISIGSGIGAGIIFGGQLRHGCNHLCGEIGYSLPDVSCEVSREKTGWLDESISRTTLYDRFEGYRQSHRVDEAMLSYVTRTVCPYIANLVNTLDISLVVIGGELVLNGGNPLLEAVQREISRLTLSNTQIQTCLSEYAGIVGTALIASNNLFNTIL